MLRLQGNRAEGGALQGSHGRRLRQLRALDYVSRTHGRLLQVRLLGISMSAPDESLVLSVVRRAEPMRIGLYVDVMNELGFEESKARRVMQRLIQWQRLGLDDDMCLFLRCAMSEEEAMKANATRLQACIDKFTRSPEQFRQEGYESGLRDGATKERAAILRFLRDRFGWRWLCLDRGDEEADLIEEQLAAVERGEHVPETKT